MIIKTVSILSLLILPITMLLIIRIGSKNFNRECRRMYEHRAIAIKVEEELGFRADRKKPLKNFPKEDKFIPPRFEKKVWGDTEQFIDYMVHCEKDSLYGTMNRIFGRFKYIALVLMALILVFVILHQLRYWFSSWGLF